MKNLLSVLVAATGITAGASPDVENVGFDFDADTREAVISYSLTEAPAIVTVDVESNASGEWKSVGGENLQYVTGDVNQKIATTGKHEIRWDASQCGDGAFLASCRAVVTAWTTENPPDYLVVELLKDAPVRHRYYPGAEFVPGGILGNPDYRLTKLVLRKIPAKNVKWMMGSKDESGRVANQEWYHEVTLENDYYMSIFPLTAGQVIAAMQDGSLQSPNDVCNHTIETGMRPYAGGLSFTFRQTPGYWTRKKDADTYECDWQNSYYQEYGYPNDPNPSSILGKIRTRTGLPLDYPGHAQWEYACRAGYGNGFWNTGKPISEPPPGRYNGNGGGTSKSAIGKDAPNYNAVSRADGEDKPNWTPENGLPVVGSYEPNRWGLYDMHGGVAEATHDYYVTEDISELSHGEINVKEIGTPLVGKIQIVESRRLTNVFCGGAHISSAANCRSSAISKQSYYNYKCTTGYRLMFNLPSSSL